MGSATREGTMPLSKPKPRKSQPTAVAGSHMERIKDGKLLYCVIDKKGTLWCKPYLPDDDDDKLWKAYAYESKQTQGKLF